MIHSVFNHLFVKILIQLHLLRLGQKKVALFPETGPAKKFLALTRSHSRMCIRIYLFIYLFKSLFTVGIDTSQS